MKFLHKDIIKQILFIAIPIIIGNLLQIAYQMTDLFWLGKVGTNQIAAIALSIPILFVFFSVGIGVSIAGLILVAIANGKKQRNKINHISGQIMLLITTLGIFTAIIGIFLSPYLLNLTSASQIVKDLAIQYTQISFIGMIFLYGMSGFKDLMAGVQQLMLPLKIILFTVILNLILDPILIIYFNLGIKGAAISTITTQALAFLIALTILVRGNHIIKIIPKEVKPDFKYIKKIIKLAIPSTIEISAISISELVLLVFVSKYSTELIAAFGIGTQIFNIIIYISIGFLVATSTLVGHAIGENKLKKAKQIGITSTIFSIIINFIITIFVFLFTKQILQFFTTDNLVIASGITLLQILAITFVFFGIEKTLTGVFQGSGNPHIPSFIVILALWLIQIPLAYYLSNYTNLQELGIWWAIVIAGVLAAVLSVITFYKFPWQNKSMINENN
jgi:putative MATE family efflux protein